MSASTSHNQRPTASRTPIDPNRPNPSPSTPTTSAHPCTIPTTWNGTGTGGSSDTIDQGIAPPPEPAPAPGHAMSLVRDQKNRNALHYYDAYENLIHPLAS
ncbi:hypothetical protein GCM10027280_20530 [Micromonospora polyrhachis]